MRLPSRARERLRSLWMQAPEPLLLVLSFVALIVFGTSGLMWLPGLYVGPPLGWLDALFTVTSAVCLTGLTVVDIATYFSRWGQLWILLLIQLGGLGLVTSATLIISALGRRLSLRSEMMLGAPIDPREGRTVIAFALGVARYAFAVELAGALVLWVLWIPRFGPVEAGWHALFQSVSAFCNAGFSTFSDSLIRFAGSPAVLVILSALIILGGFGYLSTDELVAWFRKRPRRPHMSVHTWSALWVTAGLLGGGMVALAVAEWDGVLAGMSALDRMVNAFFMSVTARTAGFNTVSYSAVTNAGALLTMLLMLVGGSPASTAGGLKTTTVAVLSALAWARIRGRRHTVLHGRTVPAGTVQRTTSLALAVTAVVLLGILAITLLESRHLSMPRAREAFLPLVAVHDVLNDQMLPVPPPDRKLLPSDSLLVAGDPQALQQVANVR